MLALLTLALFQSATTCTLPIENEPQQSDGSARRGQVWCDVKVLTDTEGIDSSPYALEVYRVVRSSWFANMPPDVEKGIQAVNQVEFRILLDGNVPKDLVKMVRRSGKDEFDRASLRAINEAATPFGRLPEKFTQPFIVMQFTFYYNVEKPKTKPLILRPNSE